MKFRIGNGFDVHALVPGRPLVIGGVTIPFDRGLDGHSDADVLLHAIADAMLGALALGDLGTHFPDSDARWKGADSRVLLRHVMSLAQQRGYVVGNVDSTVIAQVPRLAPFVGQMRSLIADRPVLRRRSDLGKSHDHRAPGVRRPRGRASRRWRACCSSSPICRPGVSGTQLWNLLQNRRIDADSCISSQHVRITRGAVEGAGVRAVR